MANGYPLLVLSDIGIGELAWYQWRPVRFMKGAWLVHQPFICSVGQLASHVFLLFFLWKKSVNESENLWPTLHSHCQDH